jgi:hypothetical protein
MRSKGLKTVHVSEETWRRLMELKLELRLRSLDDVISFLLERADLRSPEEIRRARGPCARHIIRELEWVLGEEG